MTQTGKEETGETLTGKDRQERNILTFLGLATKAGKTVSGADAVSEAVVRECAYLVLVAEDASDGSVPDWALLNHASIAS